MEAQPVTPGAALFSQEQLAALQRLRTAFEQKLLDEDEYKTKLAELTPKKERTRADELADLEALKNDGILDDDEYRAKLKELQDDEPPAKKAKTEEEDYEQLTVTKLKAKSKERGLAATGEKGILIWRLKLKDRHAEVRCADGADPFSFRGAALKKAAARQRKQGLRLWPPGTGPTTCELEATRHYLSASAPGSRPFRSPCSGAAAGRARIR